MSNIPADGIMLGPGRYKTGTGQEIVGVHPMTEDCVRYGCVIRAPSDHSMRSFPTYFRGDRGLMERICPHGIGHPDPDHLSFVARTRGEDAARAEGVDGCDGGCF